MAAVELLYFADCPNVPAARKQLRRAFDAVGASPRWIEVDVASETAPAHTRGYGSPTILVNGREVTQTSPGNGASCRIYAGSDVRGVPPLEAIVAALRASPTAPPTAGAASALAVAPGALLAVLPVVSCPSCWPAYAGVLSSLGVPFLMAATWLLPLTVATLAIALAALAFRARQRRGFGPLILGVAAAGVIMFGKFALEIDAAAYAGAALLVGASLWNRWPKHGLDPCEGCGCAQKAPP